MFLFVQTDILLVVESVGVQIVSKRTFPGLESSEFLPWNTIQDIFINEVITGVCTFLLLTTTSD